MLWSSKRWPQSSSPPPAPRQSKGSFFPVAPAILGFDSYPSTMNCPGWQMT